MSSIQRVCNKNRQRKQRNFRSTSVRVSHAEAPRQQQCSTQKCEIWHHSSAPKANFGFLCQNVELLPPQTVKSWNVAHKFAPWEVNCLQDKS